MLAGVALVVLAHDVLMDAEIDPQEYEEADFKKLVLILGVLTVHSFPRGSRSASPSRTSDWRAGPSCSGLPSRF